MPHVQGRWAPDGTQMSPCGPSEGTWSPPKCLSDPHLRPRQVRCRIPDPPTPTHKDFGFASGIVLGFARLAAGVIRNSLTLMLFLCGVLWTPPQGGKPSRALLDIPVWKFVMNFQGGIGGHAGTGHARPWHGSLPTMIPILHQAGIDHSPLTPPSAEGRFNYLNTQTLYIRVRLLRSTTPVLKVLGIVSVGYLNVIHCNTLSSQGSSLPLSPSYLGIVPSSRSRPATP